MTGFFIFSLLFAFGASAAPVPASHLDAGRPGCWNRIHGSALTDAEVSSLPEDCKNLRTDYFASIEAVKKDPSKFEKNIVQTITQAKHAKTPYEAIFFATLIHSKPMIEALKARAEIEKKLKVPFQYAVVAVYKLQGNDCVKDPHYSHVFYREICYGEDSILPTFFAGGLK